MRFTQGFQHIPTVDLWQHEIQHDRVVIPHAGFRQTVLSIGGRVHGVAVLFEDLREESPQVGLVFNDKNTHKQTVNQVYCRGGLPAPPPR